MLFQMLFHNVPPRYSLQYLARPNHFSKMNFYSVLETVRETLPYI